MRPRKILNILFGLMMVGLALYALFPRFQNNFDCENSIPQNSAESAALADARSRKSGVCSASPQHCKFEVDSNSDGMIEIDLYFVEKSFFEGCIVKDRDLEAYFYNREGVFVRLGDPPFE